MLEGTSPGSQSQRHGADTAHALWPRSQVSVRHSVWSAVCGTRSGATHIKKYQKLKCQKKKINYFYKGPLKDDVGHYQNVRRQFWSKTERCVIAVFK